MAIRCPRCGDGSACGSTVWQPDCPLAVRVELPFSEVCMHMRVAGRLMLVRPLPDGMAQILNEDGSPFSAPVTRAEAGLPYEDRGPVPALDALMGRNADGELVPGYPCVACRLPGRYAPHSGGVCPQCAAEREASGF